MSIRLNTRLSRLDRKAEFVLHQLLPGMFEEMHISQGDFKLLDGIYERGELATPDERGAWDRFLAEYQRAFNLVSREPQNNFR